tara:strand:+ start:135 stop:683 length:549 start_codon:yes stop_codon:yes gene_type:complete
VNIIIRAIIFIIFILSLCKPLYAYTLDYSLDDRFIVETFNTKTGIMGTQIWNINLRRGLMSKGPFIDLEIIIMNLRKPFRDGHYRISDIVTYEYSQDSFMGKAIFSKGVFDFELGAGSKLKLRIEFNEDGSLKDVMGSYAEAISPDNVTTYRLVKDKKKITMEVNNWLPTKEYRYHRRQVKK